jgi:hypothetical protein
MPFSWVDAVGIKHNFTIKHPYGKEGMNGLLSDGFGVILSGLALIVTCPLANLYVASPPGKIGKQTLPR